MNKKNDRSPRKSTSKVRRKSAGPISPEKPVASGIPVPAGQNGFTIVGVGASAGGLEAFTELLRHLPPKPGMSFIFVQHLDPKHISALAELLGRESQMPVQEAANGVRVRPNQVYVIPRNTSIWVKEGVLSLGPRELVGGQLTGIDTFFRSLAEDRGRRAVGVLLSGNASDGTLGLNAIKAGGGITLAQDPESAKFDGMPRGAIASGSVDFIGRPSEIAAELMRVCQAPYVDGNEEDEENEIPPDGLDAVAKILALLKSTTGVDFTNYKSTTIKRRILRRLMLKRRETIAEYLEMLAADPSEVHALYEDILINVTEFFRDPEVYEALRTSIFPHIAPPEKTSDQRIRIWTPGCSTGEEVYSIAIALLEYLDHRADSTGVQIFATDISETALERARAGIYPQSIVQSVSAERLRRFFVKIDSGYQIHKRVRELCVFAKHNLAQDAPFSKLDLISCRNVLIYLGPVLQTRIIPTFHYALNPSGYLLLGTSETVGPHSELFNLIDKKHKIYSRRPGRTRPPVDFTSSEMVMERQEPARREELWTDGEIQREADRLVLQKYGPSGVVVDDDLTIVQFRGNVTAFIEPAAGVATLNLLRMVKEGLAVPLKNAIEKSRRENVIVRREDIRIPSGPGPMNVEVIPFRRSGSNDRRFLVLLQVTPELPASGPGKRSRNKESEALERENEHLRRELAESKEYLQSIIEDQEAAHEELRSASEEIQSSNEELQSTNEELETAKEELQSTNEELNTVNEELQNRNAQLTQVGNDLLNLLYNVNIPILILGNDLRIRRFTPVTERALNLIASDVGRPVRDMNLKVRIPNLEKVLLDVIENLSSKALDVSDVDGRTYSLRIRPYRTEDNKIDGVVMVFVDIEPRIPVLEDEGHEPAEGADRIGRIIAHFHDRMQAKAPEDLRSFATALLQAQEDERRRLSHELHDELNQKLALLELNIQNLEDRPPATAGEIRGQLKIFKEGVSDLSADLRRIAYQLHPSVLEDFGLVVALRSYCNEFAQREGIEVQFSHRNIPGTLPHLPSLCLYRVLQESLRNVAKHSGANRATVTLHGSENRLEMTVRDTGSGFDPGEAKHPHRLGLVGMQERVRYVGGVIHFRTKPGEGTQVTVIVPTTAEPGAAPGGPPPKT